MSEYLFSYAKPIISFNVIRINFSDTIIDYKGKLRHGKAGNWDEWKIDIKIKNEKYNLLYTVHKSHNKRRIWECHLSCKRLAPNPI
jgi:hypothetical protein